ncbi:MAG: MerR family transcriptional regulator [Polyangiales bacterium]
MAHALKLDELATRAGVSPRTVRYYIQRGLLPAPDFKGPDTAYGEKHLLGLRVIRKLQDAYWPLDAIASALHGKDEAGLQKLLESDLSKPKLAAKPEPAPEIHVHRKHVTRIALAPGLELLVDDEAPESSQKLVERIQRLLGGSS